MTGPEEGERKLYQIILVDDEPHIRKGLAGLIPWEDYGVEIVGEAENGVAAMALIGKVHPDIAVVDIRMPHMDGLQLLEQMKDRPGAPKFIMLSGYDQFDYVKTAMRMGAHNYLLKPVDPDELKATIIDITATLCDEAEKKQQFDESMRALLNSTLNRLLANQIEVRELREKCKLLDISLRCNHMAVGIVKPIFDNQDVSLRWIVFRCLDICKEQYNCHTTAYPVADSKDNIVLIIKNPDAKFSHSQLLEYLRECAAQIERQTQVSCVVALGTEATSFKDIAGAYQNALRMLEIKCMWGDEEIKPDTVATVQQTVNAAFDLELMTKLLLQDDQAQLEQLVHIFFHRTLLKDRVANLALVKYHLIELVTCALQAAHKCYVPTCDLAQIRSDVYSELQICGTLQSLEELVSGMLRDLCTRVQHIDTGGYSPKVQFAVRYVHRHYNDSNLSLKTLADKLAVNSAYLGRQFSLETGVFFSDYLNEVRIQHAKQLLNTTPLKLAEVAERVGFVNVSYFSTIYKKLTGERPGQSRKYGKT